MIKYFGRYRERGGTENTVKNAERSPLEKERNAEREERKLKWVIFPK